MIKATLTRSSRHRQSQRINLQPHGPQVLSLSISHNSWLISHVDGGVKVRGLSVRYSEDGPDVLHNISFDIQPKERVGVVGRTGAGKSSLALSLLRFTIKSHGNITINGRDIDNVNLDALRQRVTIIPQDPILFSGTIRSNLDPFGDIDDSDLQQALEGSGLTNASEDGPDSGIGSEVSSGAVTPVGPESGAGTRKITLDTEITAGGENLSQGYSFPGSIAEFFTHNLIGQRQLLAFSRALVRRSKLVILDEVCFLFLDSRICSG